MVYTSKEMKQAISLVLRISLRGEKELLEALINQGNWFSYVDFHDVEVFKELTPVGRIVRETVRDEKGYLPDFNEHRPWVSMHLNDEQWRRYVREYPELFQTRY